MKAFTRLRRAPTNGGAPHKPVLLLSVLHGAQEGGLEDDRVRIAPELVALFRSYWNVLVTTQHDCLMSLPFFHMKTEGFWHLEPRSGFTDVLGMNAFSKSLVKLDAAIEGLENEVQGFWLETSAQYLAGITRNYGVLRCNQPRCAAKSLSFSDFRLISPLEKGR